MDQDYRKLFIADSVWRNVSASYKNLKPNRNFDHFDETDETKHECYKRLKQRFNIPVEVIEQWIYPHYYNENSVINYAWIDYSKIVFEITDFEIGALKQINVIEDYLDYVECRKDSQPYDDFMCTKKDLEHWQTNNTWRVPPIILDVETLPTIPEFAEIKGPYQLVEGHSRLGYLLSLDKAEMLLKRKHEIFLMKYKKV